MFLRFVNLRKEKKNNFVELPKIQYCFGRFYGHVSIHGTEIFKKTIAIWK